MQNNNNNDKKSLIIFDTHEEPLSFSCDTKKAHIFLLIYRKALRHAHLEGMSFGLSEAFMFFANAAAFKYGGHLVVEGDMSMGQVMK